MIITSEQLTSAFRELFGDDPKIYRAPGRVNLIGEHTDYNDGFVMPAAIDRYVWTAIAKRADRKVRIHSVNYSMSVEFDLDEPDPTRRGSWIDYAQGVAVSLQQAGCDIGGANILVSGDVPVGAGLSSSAAFEVSLGYAMLDQFGAVIDRMDLAKLCQRAENDFVGMRCGLMDQFTACNGEKGKALMLDCRTFEYSPIEIPTGISLVVCNTMVKHELASSEYNTRRAECEEGVSILARLNPAIASLRDVSLDELEKHENDFPQTIYPRCRHVVTENARVLRAQADLTLGDVNAFGALMYESHESLRGDYEVSCSELDLMVATARSIDDVYGARMTGGGFGGCTINFVDSEKIEDFKERVTENYKNKTGISPEIYVLDAVSGAEKLESVQSQRFGGDAVGA